MRSSGAASTTGSTSRTWSARRRSSGSAHPASPSALARSVAHAVARLRELDLIKRPGAAEAIDWAEALSHLGAEAADGDHGRETLGWVVKNREDLGRVEPVLTELLRD